jgi:peptidoglycan/LPS O-acetylase OafA/YrhL
MIKRRRLMRHLGKACNVIALMVAGAGLLAVYLAHANPLFDRPLRDLRSDLSLTFFVFLTLGSWLSPTRRRSAPEGNSAWIGVVVIVVTGMAGVAYVASHASTGDDYIVAAAILLITIIIAAVAARFVAKHGPEIGEARFMTTERQ